MRRCAILLPLALLSCESTVPNKGSVAEFFEAPSSLKPASVYFALGCELKAYEPPDARSRVALVRAPEVWECQDGSIYQLGGHWDFSDIPEQFAEFRYDNSWAGVLHFQEGSYAEGIVLETEDAEPAK